LKLAKNVEEEEEHIVCEGLSLNKLGNKTRKTNMLGGSSIIDICCHNTVLNFIVVLSAVACDNRRIHWLTVCDMMSIGM
jgi:hypothetical protein